MSQPPLPAGVAGQGGPAGAGGTDRRTSPKGPLLTCPEFLPGMIEAGDGCIANKASTAGVCWGRQRAAAPPRAGWRCSPEVSRSITARTGSG
jgi:hypothetical protein